MKLSLKKSSVKFSDRVHPKKGILSVIFAMLGFVCMVVMIVLSAMNRGAGAWYVGLGGMAALLLTVVGFVLAVLCFRMNQIYYRTPICGAAVNGVLLLAFLALYVYGF